MLGFGSVCIGVFLLLIASGRHENLTIDNGPNTILFYRELRTLKIGFIESIHNLS